MIAKLRENWVSTLVVGGVLLWIVAFFVLMSAGRGCREAGAIWEQEGACLWRRIAGLSCPIGIELAFGVGAGLQAKGRGYPFWMGFLLGFFFSVLGAYFVMSMDPKGTVRPPMETWRKRLIIGVIVFTVLLMVFTALRNLGKLP